MITAAQAAFLKASYAAGLASQHPWPDYAACETAVETKWGTTKFAKANNLFCEKRDPSVPLSQCMYCDTQEQDSHGHWYTEHGVAWPKFATWTDAYNARIALLRRLAPKYPNYAAALHAQNGADFVTFVSRTWSTGLTRSEAVLAIYRSHRDLLAGIQ